MRIALALLFLAALGCAGLPTFQNPAMPEPPLAAGNEATASLPLTVDTTPPDVTATVKVVVEGKVERGSAVFVDGNPVSVDLLGNWRVELVVKRGQRTVEIVAIDQNGNEKTEQRSIGVE